VIEHGDLAGHGRRVRVRQVDGAGAEPHALDAIDQRGKEHGARGDVLGAVGDMLTRIAFDEPKLVGQYERLAVLGQAHPPILLERMDRHREEAELH
jgi:hypothetical protein